MEKTKLTVTVVLALCLMVWMARISEAAPVGTAFTYQGSLNDGGAPADGLYDFQFRLFDDANTVTGNQVGSTIDINDLDVIDGYFTVELDFGRDIFTGSARWLETTVARGDGSDPCTLSPRVELTATPYALGVRVPLKLEGSMDYDPAIEARNSMLYPHSTMQLTNSFEAVRAGEYMSFGVKGTDDARVPSYPYCIPEGWGKRYGYGGYFTSLGSPGCACASELTDCSHSYGVYGKAGGANYNYGVYGLAEGSLGYGVGVYGEGKYYAGYFVGRGYFSDNVGIGMISPNEKLTVDGALSLGEISPPSASDDYGKIYVKNTDSKLYFKNDAGREYQLSEDEESFVVGDYLLNANDTQKPASAMYYVPVKETKLGRGGSLKIKFDLRASSNIYPVYAKIYRNGIAIGAEQITSSVSYVTFTEDISGWSKGDLVQVYGKTINSSNPAWIMNLRLYVDNPPEAGGRL